MTGFDQCCHHIILRETRIPFSWHLDIPYSPRMVFQGQVWPLQGSVGWARLKLESHRTHNNCGTATTHHLVNTRESWSFKSEIVVTSHVTCHNQEASLKQPSALLHQRYELSLFCAWPLVDCISLHTTLSWQEVRQENGSEI